MDTYEELVAFAKENPIIFISHQWHSWATPDPTGVQYREMVAAAEAIARNSRVDAEEIWIFLDYLSIPQKNAHMRLAAIETLGVFASIARYFVVVAPPVEHVDTGIMCDKISYSRRGWCRLEQWGHMCTKGMANMFFWSDGELRDLADRPDRWAAGSASSSAEGSFAKADWYKDSVMVFSGEYTNPGNKAEMVDVVLGLYAMVIRERKTTTKRLFEMTQAHLAEVFPYEYFEDLPQRLKQLMQYDKSTEGDEFRTILNAADMELSKKPKTRRSRTERWRHHSASASTSTRSVLGPVDSKVVVATAASADVAPADGQQHDEGASREDLV